MKKFNLTLSFFAASMLVAAWGGQDKNVYGSTLTEQENGGSIYERSVENVLFQAEVIGAEKAQKGELQIPQIQLQYLDEEKVTEAILKDISIKETDHTEFVRDDGKESAVTYYTGENGEDLSVNPDSLSYSTPHFLYVMHSFDLERNPEKYSTNAQLAFMDPEDAWEEAEGILDTMGVELGTDVFHKYYALDRQTLAAEEYVLGMDGNIDQGAYKPEWTEQDEGYYFCAWQSYDGIPVHCSSTEFIKKYGDFNAPLQLLLTPGGMSYLNLGRTFIMEPQEEVRTLASLDEIADTFLQKMTMIITDASYRVDSMELCYYPLKVHQDTYEMTAIWVLDYVELQPSGETRSLQMGINAFTAEEVY